jgi:plastocyanin
MRLRLFLLLCWLTTTVSLSSPGFGQSTKVSGRLELTGDASREQSQSGGAVWLVPLGETKARVPKAPQRAQQLVQHHKSFSPHLLIIQVGSSVQFPNHDPFFHNVFSLFDGKRFDLGLYEAGTTRTLVFDRTGICYIFCNIHAEMSAVILVLDTPYFAVSDRNGEIVIPGVVPGVYELRVWQERAAAAALNAFTRKITIGAEPFSFGVLRISEQASSLLAHKNKYGQDYEPPAPDSPLYAHP